MTRRFNELKLKSLTDTMNNAIQLYELKCRESPFYQDYQIASTENDRMMYQYELILKHRLPTKEEDYAYQASCDTVDQLRLQLQNSVPEYELQQRAIKDRLDFLLKLGSSN
jgi:hypothetical protein